MTLNCINPVKDKIGKEPASELFGETDKSMCRLFSCNRKVHWQDCTAVEGERVAEVENACTYMFPGTEEHDIDKASPVCV